jgi:hypothetical protein
MIDPKKLQCFTTASWLRGYVDSLDEYRNGPLIYKLHQAADLLEEQWDEYAVANGYQDIKVPLHVPARGKNT